MLDTVGAVLSLSLSLSLSLLLTSLPSAAASTNTITCQPPVLYTIPCTMGNNAPCSVSPGWTCTPTQACASNLPCGGLCINGPPTSTPPVIPCTVGNDAPCPKGSTCTPTTYSTPGQPWPGQCYATPTPVIPLCSSSSSSSAHTICTVGNDAPCSSGSTCTPTMTCTSGLPCGGACISAPVTTPTPTPTGCGRPRTRTRTKTKTRKCHGWEHHCREGDDDE